MELQINGNKIFAPLKNKELVLTPEERVRQEYICRLVNVYGYSLEQMAQEVPVSNSHRGQGKARADIVIWRSESDKKEDVSAIIVVECKAEYVTIQEEDYYQGSNYASWAGADFFVTTNLKETRIFKVVKGKIPKRLEEIVDIPKAEDLTNAKKIKELLSQTKAFTRDEFSRLLFNLQRQPLMKSARYSSLKSDMNEIIPAHRFFQRKSLRNYGKLMTKQNQN